MTNVDFDASMRRFVEAMATHEPDPDERAFCDSDPDTWLSAPVEQQVQQLPVCFEHDAITNAQGVTTCARCGASEEEIVAEHEAQLEAAVALGTYPDVDTDDEPDSDDVCDECGELGHFCGCRCDGCQRSHDACLCDDSPASSDEWENS